MADQRDWDPEIDGAAAAEGGAMTKAFYPKGRPRRPRGVSMGDIKKDFRSRPVVDLLAELNVICGKVVK